MKKKLTQVKPYSRRTGSVSGSLRQVGRRIEWDGVRLWGENRAPVGSLVASVTEYDKEGNYLWDGEGAVTGLIHAKRISIRSILRQHMRYWHSGILYGRKHYPEDESDCETGALLLTLQRVKDSDLEDVPGQSYEVFI